MAKAHFFSVSSGLAYSKVAETYIALEPKIRERFPQHSVKFLGSPFRGRRPPVIWKDKQKCQAPMARLFRCWAGLEDFCAQHLVPALTEAATSDQDQIIVTKRFGLEAVIYSLAHCNDCGEGKEIKDMVTTMHHDLVFKRLRGAGIKPPLYLLLQADREAMKEGIVRTYPALGNGRATDLDNYLLFQEETIENYFTDRTGQRRRPLDATQPMSELCDQAVAAIAKEVELAQ